jgi:hypothetical protein
LQNGDCFEFDSDKISQHAENAPQGISNAVAKVASLDLFSLAFLALAARFLV